MKFPFYRQYDAMDCGPTCLRMIAKHYGKTLNLAALRRHSRIGREGVSLLGISEAAEKIGFKTLASRLSFGQLDSDALLPCILHWKQNHFVVLPPQNYSAKRRFSKIWIADPAEGLIRVDRSSFMEAWCGQQMDGIVLQLDPGPEFNDQAEDLTTRNAWSHLLYYLSQHRKYFIQVFIGLLAASLLQLVFPFLTQSIVDVGINSHNLSFIYIILLAQFMLFFARTGIEFVRNRLMLFISTHINISLLTGFWYKILKLPISYFDTKLVGDIQQRIRDQHQIEDFLTGSSFSVLFSMISLIIFSIVLWIYSFPVLGIFLTGSFLYFLWVRIFMNKRRDLNYRRFALSSKENAASLQLIYGLQEIKLNNSEQFFRWDWEHLQARLFRLNFKYLSLSQYQQAGALFLNEGKNILITFFVARLVLNAELSLGQMLAIQYIIGQLNSPVEQLVIFSQNYQDARIALERLQEIQEVPDEECSDDELNFELPINKGIQINNLSFRYPAADSGSVLSKINLQIPEQKVTAIVGTSGSGKTSLIKLLLKFYEDYEGTIQLGDGYRINGVSSRYDPLSAGQSVPADYGIGTATINLKKLSPSFWRSRCGSVMQDGFIFNDSILGNIAVGQSEPDRAQVLQACHIANILSFIESLPRGFHTRIGAEGNGLSQGQRQRILIARAIYKNPDFLFFDEATNALDANNERVIMERLQEFFLGRTVVIVAHRLSTVRNADKIIVLERGAVVEEGSHDELIDGKGHYYELIRNQLELGA